MNEMTIPESFPAFIAVKHDDGTVTRSVSALAAAELPEGEVTIAVEYSGVNWKDSGATIAGGGIARISPLVAGVDLAGRVIAVSGSGEHGVAIGSLVVVHGYELGTGRHGGYAPFARVPASWVVPLPAGLSSREAMILGTAGFTAAQSIHALEARGLKSAQGPVLVTGATGGVGSCAVQMLAHRGYTVAASTGKAEEHQFLKDLGAAEVIDRNELSAESTRPMDKERWAGAVDCVGGTTLASVIRQLRYGASVAASGLTGGPQIPATVFPFILRGVNLLGIDSVNLDMVTRRELWWRLASDLKPPMLDALVTEIGLDGLDDALTRVRAGQMRGRTIVRLP